MEDQGGMGSPVLSLEGFFQLEAELPERIQALMRARKYAQDAVREENEYWARLSSTVLCDEVDPAQFGNVQEEFKEYARHWALYGSGVDVITDFQGHMNLRASRVQRNIDRKMRKEAKLAALQASNAPAATSHVDCHKGPDMYEDGVVEPLPFDPNVALSMLEVVETTLRTVEDQIVKDVPQLERDDREMFTVGFSHMMQTFSQSGEMRRKYGAHGTGDRNLASSLKVGNDVPSYFANVSDGSIFRRKVLSMAGLRNLIIYGPMIYVQLRDLHFSGDLEVHPNDAGLKLMRRVTGNVVDLDTTVLRCTDAATMNAINASNKHKGLPVHAHSDAFASSPQAQEIATNCAVPLLEDFARACGITTTAAMQARRIDPKQISKPIPVAGTNTDRGKHPVWQYVNAGQNSFHANVPTMADVNGALLKAPFHCLRAWLKLHALHTGDELKTRIADFFEHCVVDSCFNGKWKSIEEYNNRMAHEGTIVDVLQRVQMKNQAIFTADFFDNDNDAQDNEVAEMTRLAAGLVGRDKSGVTRGITGDDVRAWVQDPSVTI